MTRQKCSFRWCDFDAAWVAPAYLAEAAGSPECMCEYHFAEYSRFKTHPTPGLDPQLGASDWWRPSILEMLRHAILEMRRKDRAQQPPTLRQYAAPMLQREQRLPPRQRSQLLFMRDVFRRHARPSAEGRQT